MKKYITLAAIALAFAACTQEDIAPQDNQKDTPITILSAGVAELSTRAVTDGKLVGTENEPVEMGVFVTGGSADEYNCFNAKFTHDGTSWTGETVLYEGSNSQQKIYAIYPYNEEYSSDKTVGGYEIYITPNQLEDPQVDYLYSEPMPIKSSSVSLIMEHLLTKLVLEAEWGTDLNDDPVAKVEVQEMHKKSDWWAEDDTWEHYSRRETTISMKKNSDTSYEAIVLPICGCNENDKCTSFPLVITTSKGRVFKADVTCPAIGRDEEDNLIYGLAQGFQYTIKMRVGKDKVELGDITADAWTEVTMDKPLETE